MTRAYRIIDLRGPGAETDVQSIQAKSPETAVLDVLGIEAVRSGAKKDLIARVYWQSASGEPTNMVRLYRRTGSDEARGDAGGEKHLSH